MRGVRTLIAWLAFALIPAVPVASAALPHIVYFLVDDMGFANVGFNSATQGGPTDPRTPAIDALHAEGVELKSY
jgi:hypothetical protein